MCTCSGLLLLVLFSFGQLFNGQSPRHSSRSQDNTGPTSLASQSQSHCQPSYREARRCRGEGGRRAPGSTTLPHSPPTALEEMDKTHTNVAKLPCHLLQRPPSMPLALIKPNTWSQLLTFTRGLAFFQLQPLEYKEPRVQAKRPLKQLSLFTPQGHPPLALISSGCMHSPIETGHPLPSQDTASRSLQTRGPPWGTD